MNFKAVFDILNNNWVGENNVSHTQPCLYPLRYCNLMSVMVDVIINSGLDSICAEKNAIMPSFDQRIPAIDRAYYNRKNFPIWIKNRKIPSGYASLAAYGNAIIEWSRANDYEFFSTPPGFRFKTEEALMMFRLKFL